MTPVELLAVLEPTAAKLYDRHMGVAKEWFPHEYVPWSRGRDFDPERPWSPDDADFGDGEWKLPEAVRISLFVNLLTEDNLPYYTRDIHSVFGGDSAYGAWARNWTAEEGRHAIVIRDYLTVTRALDPVALERARMHQVRGAQVPAPDDLYEALAYLSMQELATRIAHRNTGKLIEDQAGQDVMLRVGNDENLHYLFYRDLATAALEVDPSSMMIGIERAVRNFAMPGTGIENFDALAKEIAKAGIYDFRIHHEQILVPVILRHWKVADVTGLSTEGEKAREALIKRIDKIGRVAGRLSREPETV
ncbi:MAG: acyl-ACP desaturase [Actinobacteria bacterium]|jgi:acyl-[acyl-carrier-protein] desaturase|nr:acyl-ACP desaturase [Actinomycetota bacterium]NCZ67407.1 acyl-ACP desaturase [Acidimicrobiia bacterium]NCZ87236.1 acyl-ACP desaturase [Actinomycetota bacterium]NDC11806.1 acyl-ACP desaturase [Actinomycetota bacterium]NDD61656.1 acyl-ACP desaturase [Actinomycetota bacterium]